MTVPDRFRGRKTVSVYGLTFALPMVVWQLVFFVFPLVFLVALTFWLVKNYRMVPGFDSVNWVKMYTRGYFWNAFGFTFTVAFVATAVTSVLAFPASCALAFNVSAAARRWAVFFPSSSPSSRATSFAPTPGRSFSATRGSSTGCSPSSGSARSRC